MTTSSQTPLQTVTEYYHRIDTGDLDGAFALFAVDANVKFGDGAPLEGRDAVGERVRSMVVPIAREVKHEIVKAYEFTEPNGNTTVVCEAVVTYTMLKSGKVIPHNAVTISEVGPDGTIVEQRNVGDLRPVIEDHKANSADG